MHREHLEADDPRLLRAEIRRLRRELASVAPSLEVMLQRRGFLIHKKNPSEDLIVPDRDYDSAFYDKMKKYSFRLFLRDVIRFQDSFSVEDVTKFATKRVSADYIEFLVKSGIVEHHANRYRLVRRPVKSFGETLECFVARLVGNHFQAETLWGVRFKKRNVGGDYDLIARIDNQLFYMEIKSSPPKQIYDKEIDAFLNRASDLSPDLSAFFVDTELRMKDKIVPMFEQALLRKYGRRLPVRRIVRELFHINRKIFIINAKAGIASNIDTILACYWHKPFEID
jgi:hypothetical protein